MSTNSGLEHTDSGIESAPIPKEDTNNSASDSNSCELIVDKQTDSLSYDERRVLAALLKIESEQ